VCSDIYGILPECVYAVECLNTILNEYQGCIYVAHKYAMNMNSGRQTKKKC
jgi:hypothetical protein